MAMDVEKRIRELRTPFIVAFIIGLMVATGGFTSMAFLAEPSSKAVFFAWIGTTTAIISGIIWVWCADFLDAYRRRNEPPKEK